jgi:hypothetical protein
MARIPTTIGVTITIRTNEYPDARRDPDRAGDARHRVQLSPAYYHRPPVDVAQSQINEYLFEDRPMSSFQRLAASSNADIIVYGPAHKPYTKSVHGSSFSTSVPSANRKDGDWRACYAVLDTNAVVAEFVRVEYELKQARRRSVEASFRTSSQPIWN